MAITLLVLLVDASLKSRSPGPRQQLAAGAWVDRVLPVIASSTEEGQVISGIWANGLKTPGPALASSINSVASGAARNYQTVVNLHPPDSLLGPAGLLEAALLARSQATASLKTALISTLGSASGSAGSSAPGAPPPSTVPDVTKAGSEIQVGDSAYNLFVGSVPARIGVRMPASTWAADPGPYTPQNAQVFLASLQTAMVTSPVHQLKVLSVSLNPAPVTTNGAVEVLPTATAITTTIVVADTGNQPERNLTVSAALSPAAAGASTARDFVSLTAGQAYAISDLGPLNPPPGVPVTLTVTVAPAAGSLTPPASATLTFSMPAPPPPTTTTTTTVPAKSGG